MTDLDPPLLELAGQLGSVGADAVGRGLVLASGGNLSARLPGADTFVVTGKGTWLDRLGTDDFALMDLGGGVLAGAEPSSEWKLHQRTYLARPDVTCVIHLHPQMSVLLTALGHPIRLMTLDHAFYVKSIGTTPYFPNGSDELADSAAEQAREHNCVVLGNHGCSAVADSIEMAYRRALNLEQAATATFHALQLGDTTTSFPPDELARLHHA
ncbi:class II aldolase/adducin family protein [Epidermidibacterium keratini]|uniref:Class II aldolase/adducin family protein n=1 Tax=Epidermidibacterium keratini TaxID=1891644 RepID=A0A7L4YLJ4_9ACTN|nr:class II aldolase/adducin family protein [Epidermidibacterium keratini]QHB99937.1 class II aldolase/adducin family protein [Epidermidibacterium keratini]